jgi:hypothetical protein
MPGLLKTERTAACFDNFPQERRAGDSIDVVFDQQQTHPPDTGVAICRRTLHETKSRFVHAFLPHGDWGHAAAEGLVVLPLHHLEASPSGIGWSNIYAKCARCGVAETRPSGLW